MFLNFANATIINSKYLRFTIGKLVESFVGFHIEGHSTSLTFKTCFVPELGKIEEKLFTNDSNNYRLLTDSSLTTQYLINIVYSSIYLDCQ